MVFQYAVVNWVWLNTHHHARSLAYCRNNSVVYCDLSGYARHKCNNLGNYNEDEWDDYLDDAATQTRVGRQNGNTPRDNQRQNEQFEAVLNALGINDKIRRRQLHEAISHQGMGFQEMLEFAIEFFDLE